MEGIRRRVPCRPASAFAGSGNFLLGADCATALAHRIHGCPGPGFFDARVFGGRLARPRDGLGLQSLLAQRRIGSPYDQHLSYVLDGGAFQVLNDRGEDRIARFAVVAEHPDFQQLVFEKRDVDLVQNCRCQAVLPDDDDRDEMMGAGAQPASFGGCEWFHGSGLLLVSVEGSRSLREGMGQYGSGRPPSSNDLRVNKPLAPSKKKNKFVKAWMQEHVNDPYVQEAARRGYRSRAAFKLLEIAERDNLLKPGMTVVDLGAAPGSWSQVLRERLGPGSRIIAVDMLPMEGLAGVTVLQVDFREDEGLAEVEKALAGARVDLVVSDMAPNLSGIDVVDQARSIHLGELALEFAIGHLRSGGNLLVKVFQGSGLDEFQHAIRAHFDKVHVRKPKSSRDRSRETFLVGRIFHG